jgi:membrane protein required for beta-lactamase induction
MRVIDGVKDVMFWLVVFPLVVVVAVIGGTLRVLVDMGQ